MVQTTAQAQAYERFRALHEAPDLFVMPNAWDGASAGLLAAAGFQALGTSSAAIAWALGRQDGFHQVSLADAVANGRLLAQVSGLPVNGDLEDGFGPAPEDCVATVEAAIAGGLAGLGIEDTTADSADPIHDFDAAVARVAAAAKAAKGRILLTGRTDLLLHDRDDMDEVVRRLVAFAEAGADVLYAPGVTRIEDVRTIVAAVAPSPVNILATPSLAVADLASVGVRRLSLGASLYRAALGGLTRAATALTAGDIETATTGVGGREIMTALDRA